jgi:hypothetical protein
MPTNPAQASIKYEEALTLTATVGATALQFGDLCKYSSGAMVPLADNDKQLKAYVCLGNYDAATAKGKFVPFSKAMVFMTYSGGTPTPGTAYGITGPRVIDVTDTTNLMVSTHEVDSDNGGVWASEYQLSA